MKFSIKPVWHTNLQSKLSLRDKKLIQYLINNPRATLAQMARELRVSRAAVFQKVHALKKQEILLNPILYTKPITSLYFLQINAPYVREIEILTEKLKKIEGCIAVLWYVGPFNLVLGLETLDVARSMDTVAKILSFKEVRVQKVRDHWYHPPKLFGDRQVIVRKTPSPRSPSEKEKKFLEVLGRNPTASLVDLSQELNLSAKTIKKEKDLLEREGLLYAIAWFVKPWACGKEVISVFFRIQGRKNLDSAITQLLSTPQTGNVWELDHEWNLNAILWVDSVEEVRKILLKIQSEETQVNTLVGMSGLG